MPLSDLHTPHARDLQIVAGDSFTESISLQEADGTAIDLTGYSANAQVRQWPSGRLLASFTIAIDDPSSGVVAYGLDATQTRALGLAASELVWDLEVVASESNHHTVIGGKVRMLPDVTNV